MVSLTSKAVRLTLILYSVISAVDHWAVKETLGKFVTNNFVAPSTDSLSFVTGGK